MKSLSIVMATYNGASYIREQLNSIVPYMFACDELIISDDGSTDQTLEIINSYVKTYDNIRLLEGPHKGVVKNFEHALLSANNEVILFSDQDDVWLPEKLPTIREIFNSNPEIELVHHDLFICSSEQINKGEHGRTSSETRRWRHGVINNLLLSAYYGCCIAMTHEFISSLLPFPECTIAYDQLIGLIAEHNKTSLFFEQPLIYRRVHGKNMSQKQRIPKRIVFRYKVLKSYCMTRIRIIKNSMNHVS